ncbi:antibiotic biosynthesis monooxygenase [Metallumcola ferriviriculae]|uniref:Antibiotic biosynthesis monooxygenase n=1 Tax=Metallumcola ferriviriculae TaxID=3039180 RepID=A0AAU0UPE1_9FIRM|nr:antibiotic biosynthesis monooxygenase [Desulfitibacteraceae bacterium MK1]
MITLVAKLKAQPGKETLLAEACSLLAEEVKQKEEGCIMYLPHVSIKDPTEIILVEKYTDRDALNNHSQSAHYKLAAGKFKELLAEPVDIQMLKEIK